MEHRTKGLQQFNKKRVEDLPKRSSSIVKSKIMCQIVLNPKNECFVKQPEPWQKFLFCDFPVVGLGQTLPSSTSAEAPFWAHLTVLLIIDESTEKNGSDNLAFVSWSWSSGWSNVSSEINNLYTAIDIFFSIPGGFFSFSGHLLLH